MHFTASQGYSPPFRPIQDYSRIKCFSCGQFGHTQARCPKPDSTLPYNPASWNMHSDNQQHQRTTTGKLYLDWDLTHTGLTALHQGSISPSPPDHALRNSTRNSDIIDTILETDTDNRNSFLFLNQNDIKSTSKFTPPTLGDSTVPDLPISETTFGKDSELQRYRPTYRLTGRNLWILNIWRIASCKFRQRDTGSLRDGSATIRWSFWLTRDLR